MTVCLSICLTGCFGELELYIDMRVMHCTGHAGTAVDLARMIVGMHKAPPLQSSMTTQKGYQKNLIRRACSVGLTAGPRKERSIISMASAHHANPVYNSISH